MWSHVESSLGKIRQFAKQLDELGLNGAFYTSGLNGNEVKLSSLNKEIKTLLADSYQNKLLYLLMSY